ncbi:thiol reductant ABC exporter subunit CydC [Acidisoma cellulosilytica]|uniref:Thiol reductant ABC exporter subunit CydC n=1 Tax=Acidisoma cellulosilyticum TaxID=2802395 RepID=A0A963Z169_9PROT|nr:thiol reductant ABC exporter subunit CydC [Acidisoma cellulosilyticum]MCB8879965.1 thiol reductant ABC exporter subunit CydC [Acidisoma cellulosilyticum]
MQDILAIFRLWKARTGWMAAGIILSLLAVLAGLLMMALAGRLTAVAVLAGVIATPVLLRVAGVARVILRYAERVVTHEATFRALADIRVWFFGGIAQRLAGGLGLARSGDVLSRAVSDVESLDGLYSRILVPLAGAVLVLPVLVVVLALHSAALAIIVGVLFALSAFLLPVLAARGTASAGQRLAGNLSSLRVTVLDAITGLREVRVFGAEGRMLAAVQAREANLLAAQRDVAKFARLAQLASFLLAQAAILAVLVGLGAPAPAAVAAAFLTIAAFETVGGLPRAGALAGYAMAGARRVRHAATAPLLSPDPDQPRSLPVDSTLRFEGVRFRWQPERTPVLDGLTMEIPGGSRVAILGPSGSGKSTLAQLALRLVEPEEGRILLGGVDITELKAADLRARVALLSQATHLFDDTIRANLLLARPDADERALWAALDAAQIGDMVRALPEKLDTWVGEGGYRFSGGQGRRLALARVLLSPALVVILDEPCAGLDMETEQAFLATLNDLGRGRTFVLIAHRLLGGEKLDRIWRISGQHAVAATA